ncbi:uncharacterized protein BX663DRAFT_500551 [Cokeromyces recurvatus]|uniref:uncharacterized protein n=1 Tax=Cokeromyces recurvatus TaxID=90255 RepID=UPI00221ECC1F|nr:uncharacterized protein BX663DRAFT_500551 [Cokeromyces recurvatus]KAI7905678.1 hypothetical protein BX663DRAFT_500551 [Cokeromyces recurvatus]
MLRQLNNLSKFTTSSLKCAANNTAAILINLSASPQGDSSLPSLQLVTYWIAETQRGLDAFFNDNYELAQTIFLQHHKESPFHAVGFALMAYIEAMLGFESDKIQVALERIAAAEILARQFLKKAQKKNWHHAKHNHLEEPSLQDAVVISFEGTSDSSSTKKYHYLKKIDILYELLVTSCMLMSSTIQFLRNSWLEYMKAAYKLRKTYKLYEQMFETITGQKALLYALNLKKSSVASGSQQQKSFNAATSPPFEQSRSLATILTNSSYTRSSWNEKRLSLYYVSKPVNFDDNTSCKCRPLSALDLYKNRGIVPTSSDSSCTIIDNTIESGVFFGVGLFSLIFSLLPPRVNKILNTFGFHSSRPFAIHLLQRSVKSQGLYSTLSALSLLVYYTNLSLFIHPQLLPNSLSLESTREILDQMKQLFPQGKIWKLLEGKLCKMEGKTRRGVEILRDARRRENASIQVGSSSSVFTTKKNALCELAQLQTLAVYEMGWGQIFLGDYFQASETFFRLESMNSWSRAFYRYIATCCMFADEEYDKSATEYMEIPDILKRKRHLGGRLLPNEIYTERKIRHWRAKCLKKQTTKCHGLTVDDIVLDGPILKSVVVVHPLWELIYLWNGFSQLNADMLQSIKQSIENTLNTIHKDEMCSDISQLYLLLGVSVRELGDFDSADMYLRKSIHYEDYQSEDRWVIPHALYEMATLCCFRFIQIKKDLHMQKKLYKEAHDWIHKSERWINNEQQHSSPESLNSDNTGDSDWDSRLHIRCQLLKEKLEDFRY